MVVVGKWDIYKYPPIEEHTSLDQPHRFGTAKTQQLQTCADSLKLRLELDMLGLPSLRELILYADDDRDDFLFGRGLRLLSQSTFRAVVVAFDNGRLDHLTTLRVKADDFWLEYLLTDAKESNPFCRNLKTLDCHRLRSPTDGNVRTGQRRAAAKVRDLVRLCPNLQELRLFDLLTVTRGEFNPEPTGLQLHPENKGLEKLTLGEVEARLRIFQELSGLVARLSSVELRFDRNRPGAFGR